MINFKRSIRGGVPIHVPILLFAYTLIFLVSLEFVMLFWMQSSLNTAARAIALAAATNTKYPADQVALRCAEAARQVGPVRPGYSEPVRADYIGAVSTSQTRFDSFDEGVNDENNKGRLRTKLEQLGARRPGNFWTGSGNNAQNGGCFALQNPATKQVVYHVVIHNGRCWPVFLKGLFNLFHKLSNGRVDNRGFSGWLEGRGSYQAAAALTGQDTIGVNRSLLSSGVRPFLVCNNEQNCDFDGGSAQNLIYEPGKVCKPFQPQPQRPKASTVISGYGKQVYSIDQWPAARGHLCQKCQPVCPLIPPKDRTNQPYCKGADTEPTRIKGIVNCGDIDPLIIIGLRYACQGSLFPDGRLIPAEVLSRCDHYFRVVPCNYPKPEGIPMDKVVGDVTDLDGQGNPVIVRRKGNVCTTTKVECRNDSAEVRPWVGPFHTIGANTNMQPDAFHELIKKGYEEADKVKTPGAHPLANPLDQLIPYQQVCDICNAGSPMCGFFGTCKDEEDYWQEARVVIRGQWWTNTTYYELNPMYFELECKYRRACQMKNCCWGVWNENPGKMKQYCAGRNVTVKRAETSCGNGHKDIWIYGGVPNYDRETHSTRHLPRDGGFPMCTTAAIDKYKDKVGECCAVDVIQYIPIKGGCGRKAKPSELVPAKSCSTRCVPGQPNCKDRCNKSKKYPGGFCPSPECFKYKGKCPKQPICNRFGICNKSSKSTTTIINNQTTVITSGSSSDNTSLIIIGFGISNPCYYGCVGTVPGIGTVTTSSSTSSSGDCRRACDWYYSPVFLSLDGSQIEPAGKYVKFKLNPKTAEAGQFRWIKGKKAQGFLAIDSNKNGMIDDGSELLGNYTGNKFYANGYFALEQIADKNADKLISGDELKGLLLWSDLNEDGVSQAEEIQKLTDLGVTELDAGRHLSTKKLDIGDKLYAGPHSEQGVTSTIEGKKVVGKSWDVWLRGDKGQVAQPTKKVSLNLWEEMSRMLKKLV